MITIISGTPGAGKTALIVDMMMDELKKGRKIFTIGIPKLLLGVHEGGNPHEWQNGTWLQIDKYDPERTKAKGIKSTWFPRGCPDTCEFLSTCPRVGSLNREAAPDAGALIIIDESHTDFPQRASGKAPPPYVEALTVHRHQGLDFWFVSQRPSFLDPFIRGLSSRHIHLSLNPFSFTGARNKYEWSEYQETVNRSSKLLAAKSDYKPSPAVFPLYASASVHTKLDQRMPTIMKVFIVAVICLVGIVGLGVARIQNRVQAVKEAQVVPIPVQPIKVATVQPEGGGGERSTPTAPAGVMSVVQQTQTPLKVSSCIANATRCKCYTDKGRAVALSETECRASVAAYTESFKHDDPPALLADGI